MQENEAEQQRRLVVGWVAILFQQRLQAPSHGAQQLPPAGPRLRLGHAKQNDGRDVSVMERRLQAGQKREEGEADGRSAEGRLGGPADATGVERRRQRA